jgi:hypothetical protein
MFTFFEIIDGHMLFPRIRPGHLPRVGGLGWHMADNSDRDGLLIGEEEEMRRIVQRMITIRRDSGMTVDIHMIEVWRIPE